MKIRLTLIGLIIAPLLYSCNRSVAEESLEGAYKPLNVSVGVTPQTKTPVIGKWLNNLSEINVILLDKGATSSYNVIGTYKLTRSNETDMGTWGPVETPGLIVKSDIASVLAYYPAAEDVVMLSPDKRTITPLSPDLIDLGSSKNSSKFTEFIMVLDPNQPENKTPIISATSDIDYLTGVGNDVGLPNSGVSISMNHARAMLVLNLTAEASFVGATDLRSITFWNSLKGLNPLKKGSFNLLDNKFTASTEKATYVRTMADFRLGTHYSLLVNPAQIALSDVQIVLNIGGSRYRLDVPATAWESGKVYLYNVRLVGESVELKGVNVYDWPQVITHNVGFD